MRRLCVFAGIRNAIHFVLLTEFTTEKHRAKMGISSFYFWAAGILILPLIGYFIPEWRYFVLATAALGTPSLFSWW